MPKDSKQISWALSVILIVVRPAPQPNNYQKECSENAKQLLKKAWAAQPMNTTGNKADPAKAESLYKEALKDSPKCGPACNLPVAQFARSHDYEQANE